MRRQYLTERDVGTILGLDKAKVRELLTSGDLPARHVGRRLLVEVVDWHKWVLANSLLAVAKLGRLR